VTVRPLAYAFGNARVRAMRSRLKGPRELATFRRARTVAELAEALGIEETVSSRELALRLFEGLLEDYRKLLAAYPPGRDLFEALLSLHEVENLKVAWRARSRGLPAARWLELWRPFGRLERLPLAPWRDAASLREAVAGCRRTPYAPLLATLASDAGGDPGWADMTADRWAWERLAQAARRLPRAERAARELVLTRVAARDADFVERSAAWGLTAETAEAAALAPVRRRGIPGPRHRTGRDRALQAFSGAPFRLAPAVALLWLREREVRGLEALAVSIAQPAPAALARVVASSAMGA
jgi:vacuolar-type H+-ATPase subunit C/Vma6